MGTRSRMSEKERKKWNAIKLAVGLFGAFFLVMALIGSLLHAHGQYNATGLISAPASAADQNSDLQMAKGCIGNDQSTGKTYIDVSCLSDFKILRVLCDNWPNGNITMPQAIRCNF